MGFLSSTPSQGPMEKLRINFVEKLPQTSKGNAIILVLVDQFSKFTWLIPVRDYTIEIIIRALRSMFQNFGFPKIILSDNVTSFTSSMFHNFCYSRVVKLPRYLCITLNRLMRNVSIEILNQL